MNSDFFGTSLQRDPAIALPQIHVAPRIVPGPVRSQQFVVELVGPRTAPSASVKAILNPQWQRVLGSPQSFVMAGADRFWRPLVETDTSGSFDSIALAWDLISATGNMCASRAQQFWNACEDLARQMSRRALAMPVPSDVEPTIRALRELQDSLDIGVNLLLQAKPEGFLERDVWVLATAIGLEYSPSGLFQWLGIGSERPLFELSPGEHDMFTLGQVKSGVRHETMVLGFSVPLCPDPVRALQGCLHAGQEFSQRLGAALVDDDENPVNARSAKQLGSYLEKAVESLTRSGLSPGSTEAEKLFGELSQT